MQLANYYQWIVVLKKVSSVFLLFFLFFPPLYARGSELTAIIKTALERSDFSYDLQDSLQLSKMDIASAEHRFETKIVPLTTLGFTRGTGSQRLGLEFRRETETGAAISYGAVGNRLDANSDYVITHSRTARAYIRVSQGLFRRWGREYNLTELTRAQLKAKREEILAERARQTFIFSTVQKYYNLLLAERLLMKSREARERSLAHLESARSKQNVGLVSKVDVYRAELAALDAEKIVQNQILQKDRALDALRELLQLEENETIQVEPVIRKMKPVVPPDWKKRLFSARLDWQAHRVDIEISRIELKKAKKDMSPDVGLSLTVERKGEGDTTGQALELDQTNWSVQVEMLSTLDRFNEESALVRKKMEMAKLRRMGDTMRRKIIREAEDAFSDLENEENNYQISLKRYHQAGLALDLAKTRYERGLSNNMDVLDAESSFSAAELGTVSSLTAYNIAAVKLANSLGLLNLSWIELAEKPNPDDSRFKMEENGD
ncbi:hypothetical protein DGMP_06210 [Desulfomarina profundi]|uniref:TolC family protein n=1 Tax=Desulfomarina profundi TaxID=2772557 RepID=A0A8D5JCQ3_9BACT|nr:TolC family protein [Desulfomarina profundi]BCL59928.1 hypothetical protein DGMP_06210 [Desulfomarina profundi]